MILFPNTFAWLSMCLLTMQSRQFAGVGLGQRQPSATSSQHLGFPMCTLKILSYCFLHLNDSFTCIEPCPWVVQHHVLPSKSSTLSWKRCSDFTQVLQAFCINLMTSCSLGQWDQDNVSNFCRVLLSWHASSGNHWCTKKLKVLQKS